MSHPCAPRAAIVVGTVLLTASGVARAQSSDLSPEGHCPSGLPLAVSYGIALGARSGLYCDDLDHLFPDHGDPKLARHALRVGMSPFGKPVIEYRGSAAAIGPAAAAVIHARVSGLDQRRFHGFGNATANDRPREFYEVEQYRYQWGLALHTRLAHGLTLSAGPQVTYLTTDADIEGSMFRVIGDPTGELHPSPAGSEPGSKIESVGLVQLTQPYGAGHFAQLGARADLRFALGARHEQLARAAYVEVGAGVYPALLDVTNVFGEAHATMGGIITFAAPGTPQLGVTVGGKRVWGAAPFHEAAYLGGATLRGYSTHRFAGDAAAFANTELRLTLGRAELWQPLRFGVMGLADVGRVFLDGESPGGWHDAVGGGIWVGALHDYSHTLSLSIARGAEGVRLHLQAGLPY